VTLSAPIILSNIIDPEISNYILCDNPQEEDRNDNNDSEDEEQKRALESFVVSTKIDIHNLFLNNDNSFFFELNSFNNIRIEIPLPPPKISFS
jgi:hypothetical protein